MELVGETSTMGQAPKLPLFLTTFAPVVLCLTDHLSMECVFCYPVLNILSINIYLENKTGFPQ